MSHVDMTTQEVRVRSQGHPVTTIMAHTDSCDLISIQDVADPWETGELDSSSHHDVEGE